MELKTPLIRQYLKIKKQYPECILLFRVGDFYETFGDDAVVTSKVLDIVLTKKKISKNEYVPLAGVPYHSIENYLAKLVKKGYKVAICEQVEDPKKAKGLVRRDVVRVITPGTVIESNLLEEKSNNYIMCIVISNKETGIAFSDISTGEFKVVEFKNDKFVTLKSILSKINPAEIILSEELSKNIQLINIIKKEFLFKNITILENYYFSTFDAKEFLCEHFSIKTLQSFGIEKYNIAQIAAAALIRYLKETQKNNLIHIKKIEIYPLNKYMFLDETTQRGLELVQPLHYSSKKATVFHILDNTLTPMGGRLLKKIILEPLVNKYEIEKRLDYVEYFFNNHLFRENLSLFLSNFPDLERLVGKLSLGTANPRDLIGIKLSLSKLEQLQKILREEKSKLLDEFADAIEPLVEIRELLENTIVDEPPITVREGGIIKDGFNEKLDELRELTRNNKKWILEFQEKEIKRTGINKLKIGFNKVFGYYIEITKSNLKNIPPDYIRKQTLVNAERFITPELKEKESLILSAEEKIKELEYKIFIEIKEKLIDCIDILLKNAEIVAWLDVYYSLAEVAVKNNYVRPVFNDDGKIHIIQGRHPVVEKLLDDYFVPNDTYLDNDKNQIMLITGPNMAGKSTYIRQVALIVLLAHIGSFVPAKNADVCIVDRIFTRIGAMDFIAKGQSTFLVEMVETANILNNATDKSLIILDEIGRGTSTYDGLSIAWAVIEYIATEKGKRAKTLFATHYHELTELENIYSNIKNYNIAVLEEDNKVIFLYKIKSGSTDHSYGIYAAEVAGVPQKVIQNAKKILNSLEEKGKAESFELRNEKREKVKRIKTNPLFPELAPMPYRYEKMISYLKSIDINNITPLEALNKLAKLQKMVFKKD